jgi:hypothetical protein
MVTENFDINISLFGLFSHKDNILYIFGTYRAALAFSWFFSTIATPLVFGVMSFIVGSPFYPLLRYLLFHLSGFPLKMGLFSLSPR